MSFKIRTLPLIIFFFSPRLLHETGMSALKCILEAILLLSSRTLWTVHCKQRGEQFQPKIWLPVQHLKLKINTEVFMLMLFPLLNLFIAELGMNWYFLHNSLDSSHVEKLPKESFFPLRLNGFHEFWLLCVLQCIIAPGVAAIHWDSTVNKQKSTVQVFPYCSIFSFFVLDLQGTTSASSSFRCWSIKMISNFCFIMWEKAKVIALFPEWCESSTSLKKPTKQKTPKNKTKKNPNKQIPVRNKWSYKLILSCWVQTHTEASAPDLLPPRARWFCYQECIAANIIALLISVPLGINVNSSRDELC